MIRMLLKFLRHRGNIVATAVMLITFLFIVDLGIKASAQTQKKHEIKEEETFTRPKPTQPFQPQVPGINRYQDDKVFLEYADSLYKIQNRFDTVERQILKGNVKFRQAGLWMFCDSAYYYPEANSLDAFSNVRMEQGDTLFVYADQLFYDGDLHLAKLKNGLSREKVLLINKDVTLTTDSLDYDMAIDLGWYSRWGTIDDKVNTLTSLYGEYSPKTKRAEFFTDVVLVNNRDGYTMLTDTLYYSTETHIANIESRTEIQGANDTIFTNLATYYTDSGNADLLSRSLIIHRDSTGNVTTLEGDSIIYDNATRISRAYMFQNPFKRSTPMVITDTAQKTTLIGGFGIYNDSTKEAMATIYPLLMEYSQGDTLFLRADTIKTFLITEMVADTRRKTKSGYPENNGVPIVIADSTGLWIDSTFFAVSIPYVETPLVKLLKAIPQEEKTKEEEKKEIKIAQETPNELTPLEKIMEIEQEQDSITASGLKNIREFADSINISKNDSLKKEENLINFSDSLQIISIIDRLKQEKLSDSIKIDNLLDTINSRGLSDSLKLAVLIDSLKAFDIPDSLLNPNSFKHPLTLTTDTTDSVAAKEIVDSIPLQFHVAVAYHRGRFFKQDMQGVADSIVLVEKDSMLYLFRKPIIWSGERQITGNRIDVHFNDTTADWAYLPEFGLMSEHVEEDFYNQIMGKEITTYFEDQTLRRMNVSGNVETIFLPQEEDSTFNRLVHAESSYMDVYLKKNQLDWLKMWPSVTGEVTPIFLVKRNQMYLDKFKWWGFLRPEREWYGDRIRWADNLGEVPDELEQYFLSPSDFGEPKSFTGTRVTIPQTSLPSMNEIHEMEIADSLNREVISPAVLEAENTETLENIEESEMREEEEAKEIEFQTKEIIEANEEEQENQEVEESALKKEEEGDE